MDKSSSKRYRRFFPQIIASFSINCILMTTGISVALPTVIIPYLVNDRDEIKLTYEQASWFASVRTVFLILATTVSGCISSTLGRKRAMLICLQPFIIGMILIHFAKTTPVIFIGIILLGLGTGIGDAAIVTYLGEISEPSIRGMLLVCSASMFQFGIPFTYFLGSVLPWRTVVLVALIIPVIATIIVMTAPEVPSWLLLKNRKMEAQKALQWLRGWVPFEAVKEEFDGIERHVQTISKCASCNKADQECKHLQKSFFHKFKELFERQNLSVFFIVIVLFLFAYSKAANAMQPFIVQILIAFGTPIDAKWGTVIIGMASLLGKIFAIPTIKYFGKRICAIYALTIIIIANILLVVYSVIKLPYYWTSFQNEDNIHVESSYIPLVLFTILYFFSGHGVDSLPWILMSEMFPLRNRSGCVCIVIIVSQVIHFISLKTYIYLEVGWGLAGAMGFFSAISVAGLLFIYFCLPETEGVSIVDIEEFFSDQQRKLTDVHIKKYLVKKRNA